MTGRIRRLSVLAVVGLVALGGIGLIALPASHKSKIHAFKPPETVMRRLTPDQYRNVIADVFGPDIELGGHFEPDLRIDGLLAVGTSNISVSAAGMEQYDAMARAIAGQVVDEKHRATLVPCSPASQEAPDDACAAKFMAHVGKFLYRRPLSKDELDLYVRAAGLGTKAGGDFYDGLSLSLAGMLVSPQFLFRQELSENDPDHAGGARLDAYSKAAKLSFFLRNSGPDLALMAAAESGALKSRNGYKRQVDRMLASPRVETGVRAFFADMFGFEAFASLSKDGILFPKYDALVADDAQEQTLRTITDLLINQQGDYRDIFTTKHTFLNKRLASLYRVPLIDDKPNGSPDRWQPFDFPDSDPRAGILKQISFTALHSPPVRGSATIRGKALREIMLCQKVPSPPADVKFEIVQDTSNPLYKTARERLTAHRTNPVCAGCHKTMDPIGLALENFDGSGAFRLVENGAKIDVSGELDGVPFTDAAGLGRAMHDNRVATACVTNRMTAYALGRPVPGSAPWMKPIEAGFAQSHYRLRELMRQIALSEAFTRVQPPRPVPSMTALADRVEPVGTDPAQHGSQQ